MTRFALPTVTRLAGAAALGLSAFMAQPALAQLEAGAAAPDFTVPATLGGKAFTFSLAEELKKGPVVVYFYPKAFTSGCTVEAHEFAAASDAFRAMGAQIIGLSSDGMDTLHKFSVSECGGKFPVGSDPDLKVSKSYDATMLIYPGHSDRISYLVTPDGKVYSEFASKLDPKQHVKSMMQGLTEWKAKQGAKTTPVAMK